MIYEKTHDIKTIEFLKNKSNNVKKYLLERKDENLLFEAVIFDIFSDEQLKDIMNEDICEHNVTLKAYIIDKLKNKNSLSENFNL